MTDPAGTRAFVENASSKDKMLDIIDEAEGHWHLLLTEPGADCDDSKKCSDSEHRENRRTEFKVF